MKLDPRAQRPGPYVALLLGCAAAGISIAWLVTNSDRDPGGYVLPGLALGVGVAAIIIGLIRLSLPAEGVRPMHPTLFVGIFALTAVAILAIVPFQQQYCRSSSSSVLTYNSGPDGTSTAPSSTSVSFDCGSRFNTGSLLLVAGWGVALAASIAGRRRSYQIAGSVHEPQHVD